MWSQGGPLLVLVTWLVHLKKFFFFLPLLRFKYKHRMGPYLCLCFIPAGEALFEGREERVRECVRGECKGAMRELKERKTNGKRLALGPK